MKIGVTGASGHTGANLVRQLLNEEHDVRALLHREHSALQSLPVERTAGSLADPGSLSAFCRGLDIVIHLAAKISIRNNSLLDLYRVNVEGTQNLVYAAKEAGVKRFIHFSSIHALQHSPLDEPMDESRPLALKATMPYEKTKALAEEWVREQQSDDFDVIILYPTAILGPNDYKPSLVGQFILRLYTGKLPGLVRGGYDWVDVRDVCEATITAMTAAKGGSRYVLSGSWLSVADFAGLFSQVTQRKTVKRIIPLWLAQTGVPFIYLYSLMRNEHPLYTSKSLQILQNGNRQISCDSARRDLGYHPRPLEETIRDTVEWFRKEQFV